ncbi:uncharacterized protein LOC123684641 isoform X1 [Harmonia axyridis]|uniref:uncharacterized protein LOC123684641 isoform X1 n=1 Tax=Harmonia axyridis TaxID=115357 RepID=UPI001E276C70|nr:uncharacterized protein LOC123684641 isoform X1 [Harmonia axyridis]
MKAVWLIFAALSVLTIFELIPESGADPYDYDENYPPEDEYSDNAIDHLLRTAQKRSSLIYLFRRACIRRGGNCDHRPNDCCYNSSCRCNLWGSNCRCQRMGIFQKWGK